MYTYHPARRRLRRQDPDRRSRRDKNTAQFGRYSPWSQHLYNLQRYYNLARIAQFGRYIESPSGM